MTYDELLRDYLEGIASRGDVPAAVVRSAGGDRQDMATYSLETRLTRRNEGGAIELTPLGRTFLRLRGKDGVRWLLTVETEQSRGDHDRWRMPPRLLAGALGPEGIANWTVPAVADDPERHEFDASTLLRAGTLGVLDGWPSDDTSTYTRFTVNEAMRDVVRAVIEPGPWHAAIGAMLGDERSAAIGIASSNVTDATVEQTRMITHEVRNALVPVRLHLDDMLGDDLSPRTRPRAEAARRGVTRVLNFVSQMMSLAEVMTEPMQAADLAMILDDAAAEAGETTSVAIVPLVQAMRVLVPRTRFVTAISNIIRNALQSKSPPPAVRVGALRTDTGARIQVDDAGPGVAPEDRAHIFDDGFTTKPGGSGFGLAYVKNVIEKDVRGKVWCEASDLGGARFVIELPVTDS